MDIEGEKVEVKKLLSIVDGIKGAVTCKDKSACKRLTGEALNLESTTLASTGEERIELHRVITNRGTRKGGVVQ